MAKLYRVIAIDRVPRGGSVKVVIGDVEIGLFRTEQDRFFALENRCPHRGGPLTDAMVSGNTIVCPLHGLSIELEDGTPLENTKGVETPVKSFPTVVRDGYLWIKL